MKNSILELQKYFPCVKPSILDRGPIFGLGYRSPWLIGNIIQAKIAKKYGLNVMLAQQSSREVERTNRSFKEVVACGIVSAYEANLTLPWGADGDHLRNEDELKNAATAGCTHFTFDVTAELKAGTAKTIDKICAMYFLTEQLLGKGNFTSEVSLDETEKILPISALGSLLDVLKKKKIKISEIAPKFPGYFEKGVDYYYSMVNGKKIRDTSCFKRYLLEIARLSRRYNFRVSIHSGSDKFLLYPVISAVLKDNFHLKTAGTYYLEELRVIALNDPALFREIYEFSLKRFRADRATYHMATRLEKLPDITNKSGREIAGLLRSGSGSEDLRQVLHVTYGSVLTKKNRDGEFRFNNRCFRVLKMNEGQYSALLENHIKRHIFHFSRLDSKGLAT